MQRPVRAVRFTNAGNDVVVQVKRKFRKSGSWSRPGIFSKSGPRAARDKEITDFLVANGLREKKPGKPDGAGSKGLPGGDL